VVEFVEEGLSYVRQHDKEAFLKEIINRKGPFVRGELYMYAYDFSGTVLAHGAKPHFIGKNLGDQKYIRDLGAMASRGGGWVAYDYQNPVTKKMDKKLGYVLKLDDSCWFGSGTYFDE